MNNRRKSLLLPILIGAGVLLAVTIGVTFFYNRPLFYGKRPPWRCWRFSC